MATNAMLLRNLRTLHLYLGAFIAPTLIFFAFTGALQTFGLHENSRDSDYKAPRWAVVLGQIHKKQTAVVQDRRPSPPTPVRTPGSGPNSRPDFQGPPPDFKNQPPSAHRHPLPLKIFFLLVSIGLITSTFSGIYMAYKYRRGATLITGLLLAGLIIPVILVFV